MMSLYPVRLVVREAESRGADVTPVLGRFHLSHEALDRAAGEVAADRGVAVLAALQRSIGDPDLGIAAGQQALVTDFDVAALLARSSADVHGAYTSYAKYREAWGATQMEVISPPGCITVRLAQQPPVPRLLSDCYLAASLTLARSMTPFVEFTSVRLWHRRPSDITAYTRVFGIDPTFGSDHTSLSFRADPEHPMPRADGLVSQVVEPMVRALCDAAALLPGGVDLAEQVRGAIRHQLATGSVDAAAVAARIHESDRSLRRRLERTGTTYSKLLDDVRRDRALQLVEDGGRTGHEIAALLCFADPATLSRAFRRWTGVSMSEYRGRPFPTAPQ